MTDRDDSHSMRDKDTTYRKVVLVGHCGPDSAYLTMAIRSVDKAIQVLAAGDEAALQKLIGEGVDLLLINRVLDYGFAENYGVLLIRRIRAAHPQLKLMLISNYPEAQAEAIAEGALHGFGKSEIGSPKVMQVLEAALRR